MGLCMSRCYTEVRRLSCWKPSSGIDDRDRLVDFDMFLDDQPAPRPLSISSWLSCVRGQFLVVSYVVFSLLSLEKELESSDVSLLHDSESEESDTLFELGFDNESLELQEEATVEAIKEAIKVKGIAEESTELVNPAKLAVDHAALWKLEKFYMDGKESSIERGESSHASDGQLKDQATGSSPSSSVDLEWENEDGLSPVTHFSAREDPSSDTADCSQLSTPVSNGNEELEWDGHFTSTHITQLDMETERLISEIESEYCYWDSVISLSSGPTFNS
ncbi:hypothetical protein JTE90_024436 [Oedothorax gibbosus]|uniref:Uncharacterized protein n=1 Tax=Oedothorax gibbosus TaxID=931172 RepID=A0AAV6UGH2_9ARAC|nr:hypothetical protein JTE90_024436 [Oedothorax gibbosus]